MGKFEKAAADYIRDARYKGLSATTIRNYEKVLNYFSEFFAEKNTESDPAMSDIAEWRNGMLDSGKSAASVKQYMVVLKAFFEYCMDFGIYSYAKNPVDKRLFPKMAADSKKPYEHMLSAEDLALLFENKPVYGGKLWARNYAIVCLLLDSKIRNAELLDLKLKDIDFENQVLTVNHGKGNKYREVDLTPISLTALQLYLVTGIRPENASENDYLFGTTAEHEFGGKKNGEEFHRGTTAWLSKLVERHVRLVTGKEGFRTHSMRHNGAALDLRSGSSMEALQSELGHSSITTTQIYSGKLGTKRNIASAKETIMIRDLWAERNAEALAAM